MLSGRNIGKMDVLLTIEQLTNTRNSINEDIASWSTFTQMFGERIWNSGGDKFEGKQETNLDNVIFNCRYNGSITTMMRFKQSNESTYFYITNVRSSMREGLTIINAERRDNQGDSVISNWILSTGSWRDIGVWDDTALWQDS